MRRLSLIAALILAVLVSGPAAAQVNGVTVDSSQGVILLGDGTANCSHATDTGRIRYNSATFKLQSCKNGTGWTDVGTGATAAPAGSDKQVQLNNNGVLYASSGLTFNSSTGLLGLTSNGGLSINGTTALRYPYSGKDTTGWADGPSALASQTGKSRQNTAVGVLALTANTTGQNNTAVGYNALHTNIVGQFDTAVGVQALNSTTGDSNTGLGFNVLAAVIGGAHNLGLGANVASTTLSTGSNNILIGTSNAVDTPASGTSNFLNIGNTIFATSTMTGTVAAPAGNVGIGTTAPGDRLSVYDSNSNSEIASFANGGGWGEIWVGGASGVLLGGDGSVGHLYSAGNYPLALGPNNIEKMRITTAGNVGIGTTSPAVTLDVNGNAKLASVTGAAAPTSTEASYSELAGNSNNGTLAAGGTYYGPVGGDFTMVSATDTSTYTRNLVSRAATVQNLYYLASANNSAAKTNTITVMKNGVATTLTCSVTAATTCSDTTHSFSVVAGDEIGIKIVTASATNTAVKHSWSIELSY